MLLQFQGMIAEYEKSQISERTRRCKRHRAQAGLVNALTGAPYGYRYVRKSDDSPARNELVEPEAAVVREVFRRYGEEGASLKLLARWLTSAGFPPAPGNRDGIPVRSERRFGTQRTSGARISRKRCPADRQRVTRRLRQRGGLPARRACKRPRPRDEWIEIPVPPVISSTQLALAQSGSSRTAGSPLAARSARRCCKGCWSVITTALAPLEGIHAVRVDIPARQVHVNYDAAVIATEGIRRQRPLASNNRNSYGAAVQSGTPLDLFRR